MSPEPRQLARFGCRACRACFASLEAFDLHRRGSHAEGRYCVEPLDEPGFHLVTDKGWSELDAEPRHPVRIWTTERAANARENLIAAVRGRNEKDGAETPSLVPSTPEEVVEEA